MKALGRMASTAFAVTYSVVLATGFAIGAIAVGVPYALKLRRRPPHQDMSGQELDDSDYLTPWPPPRHVPNDDTTTGDPHE